MGQCRLFYIAPIQPPRPQHPHRYANELVQSCSVTNPLPCANLVSSKIKLDSGLKDDKIYIFVLNLLSVKISSLCNRMCNILIKFIILFISCYISLGRQKLMIRMEIVLIFFYFYFYFSHNS